MHKLSLLIFAFAIIFLTGCTTDTPEDLDILLNKLMSETSKTGQPDYWILVEGTDYAHLPNQDPHNPITRDKVELGKLLFFEPGLGQNPKVDACYETYSCSSCHIPEKGFLPGRLQGIADGAIGYGEDGSLRVKQHGYDFTDMDAQGTRPLSPLNVAYMTNTLWSGLFGATHANEGTEDKWTGLAEVNHTGFMALEAQNIEGFDLHRLEINDRVLDDFGYRALFDIAFPDYPESERYTPETASFAMGAYLRSLMTTKAPFQNYLKGDLEALSPAQKKGAAVFFGKANCTNCHNNPSFSATKFYALGTQDMYAHGGLNTGPNDVRNLGRGMFTGEDYDMHKFKVPQLYNLKDYSHYFHGSSKTDIYDVIDFKIRAESENPNVPQDRVSKLLQPVDLSQQEIEYLADFLLNGLYDNDVLRFKPDYVLSGYCFPNNDWLSKQQTGCQ